MTDREAFFEEILTTLCCGDHCKAGTDHEGGCERWAFKQEADAKLAELEKDASRKLSSIKKFETLKKQWLSQT